MWAKIRNWVLGAMLFLTSLAVGVMYMQRRRADKATEKINETKVEDSAAAERQKMNAGELVRLKAEIAKVPTKQVERTPDEVEAELRRRGHVE